jgi:GT2 family glycosyltransferase
VLTNDASTFCRWAVPPAVVIPGPRGDVPYVEDMANNDREPVPNIPVLTVVIPVRNGAATLAAQLAALATQVGAPMFEVVISDNGSTDHLPSVLDQARRTWPGLDLRCIDSSARRGVSHARNAGAEAARADALVFCDSDDVVCADWVRRMAAELAQFDSVGGALDEVTLNGETARPIALVQGYLPVGLGFLPYPVGANCGVRLAVWRDLGGFDETFDSGAEEVDFFWRLQLAGHTLRFVPDAIVAYRHRVDQRGLLRQAFKYGRASCQLLSVHREHVPRESVGQITATWTRLFMRLPFLVLPGQRAGYLRLLAHMAGQVAGSRRYGVIHLA